MRDRSVGVWVLKGDAGDYTLPFGVDHLSVAWTKRRHVSHGLGHTRARLSVLVQTLSSSRTT